MSPSHDAPFASGPDRLWQPSRAGVPAAGAFSHGTEPGLVTGVSPILPRSLVLVGLMGAGKTSIGRRMAARLGLPFTDADHEIEAAAGCSITEIFDRYGEEAFRAGERRVIARLLDGPTGVLATGGGAFIDPETRGLVRDKAISLWLRADLEVLVARTSRRHTRPLLKKGDPKQILGHLMEIRYPIYAEADIVVDSEEVPPEETTDCAIAALEEFLGTRLMTAAA